MRFVWFSYYKTANRIAPCGAVYYYLWCGYAILRAILMRFMRFGEHPYVCVCVCFCFFFFFVFLLLLLCAKEHN